MTCVILNLGTWGECNGDKKHCCSHWELYHGLKSGFSYDERRITVRAELQIDTANVNSPFVGFLASSAIVSVSDLPFKGNSLLSICR